MESITIQHLASSEPAKEAGTMIFSALTQHGFFSATSPVLILSGGSNVQVAYELVSRFPENFAQLTVLQSDERCLPPQSSQSNLKAFQDAGVLDLLAQKHIKFLPMISDTSLQPTDGLAATESLYHSALSQASMVVLLAGIGSDGHTTGMLPTVSSQRFQTLFAGDTNLTYYKVNAEDSTNEFTQRLTTTLKTFALVDYVFVYAIGEAKRTALEALVNKNKPLHQLPALGLYLSQQPLTVITDLEL